MTLYYLGLGSNEEAELNCRKMIQALRDEFGRICVSSLIQTEAYGAEAPDYLNAVVCFDSSWSKDQLNRWCKQQEKALGRVRGGSHCRADMDILLAVNEPDEVSIRAVAETYFRPLVRQLKKYQAGQQETLEGTHCLSLGNGMQLGLHPIELVSDESVVPELL